METGCLANVNCYEVVYFKTNTKLGKQLTKSQKGTLMHNNA